VSRRGGIPGDEQDLGRGFQRIGRWGGNIGGHIEMLRIGGRGVENMRKGIREAKRGWIMGYTWYLYCRISSPLQGYISFRTTS
jgi:hypothetical protein